MEVVHRPSAGFLGRENRLGGPVLRESCLRPLFFRRRLATYFGSLRAALAQLCAAMVDFIRCTYASRDLKRTSRKSSTKDRLTPVSVGLGTVCGSGDSLLNRPMYASP